MDNLSSHKGTRTREMIEAAGAALKFLPSLLVKELAGARHIKASCLISWESALPGAVSTARASVLQMLGENSAESLVEPADGFTPDGSGANVPGKR